MYVKPRPLSPCKRLFSPISCRGIRGIRALRRLRTLRCGPGGRGRRRTRSPRTARKSPLDAPQMFGGNPPARTRRAHFTPQKPPAFDGLADAPRPPRTFSRWTAATAAENATIRPVHSPPHHQENRHANRQTLFHHHHRRNPGRKRQRGGHAFALGGGGQQCGGSETID